MKAGLMTVAAVTAALSAGAGHAATANCVGTGQTFTLTTSVAATCAAVAVPDGPNNLSGNGSGGNPDPLFALLGPGLLAIDKSDDAVTGSNPSALTISNATLGGNWSIGTLTAPANKIWTDLVLAFKTGGAFKSMSVWAAFTLPSGVLSGSWSTTGKNNLSHAVLYGKLFDAPQIPPTVLPPPSVLPPPVAAVPLPAAGWLMLAGLAGIAGLRARRRS